MPARRKSASPQDATAHLGFEAKLWLAADKLRNNMDAAEYKHVVLGLIFLKYISDSFEAHHALLLAGEGEYAGANPEDPDEYKAENIFWVPQEARWSHLQGRAKLPSIGKDVDDAMEAIERDNPRFKGALNKNYGRADLDKHRLGELIDLIGSIELKEEAGRSKDILGRVFEYFLTQFASAEGKNGGQFYTPSCIVRLLVEMLAPYKGRIYDPACGFRNVQHPDLRADYVLANPPFNDSDWFRKDDDVRWQFGVPPGAMPNSSGCSTSSTTSRQGESALPEAWAGFVLANGSMSSNQSGDCNARSARRNWATNSQDLGSQRDIRQKLIEADLVEHKIALPS